MSVQDALETYLPLIEAELKEIVQTSFDCQSAYYGMMRYHLGWADESLRATQASTGKRLRPVLCLLACKAAGGDPLKALPAACALELVHDFSLVHDDIQDGSLTRRGRRTVWDLWGAAQGINVGDGLFALAHMALHRLEGLGVPLARRVAASRSLDQACLALCEGQFLDITFENQAKVDLRDYLWMIRHKTAALLAASAQLGAILASDDVQQAGLYYRFGESLGMAFQIQDDVLGIWGEEKATGKSVASDLRHKKKTLPVVYALDVVQHGNASLRLASLFACQGPMADDAIQAATQVLDEIGARRYAEARAEEYFSRALQLLDRADPRAAGREDLRQLAASLVSRAA